MPPSSSLPSPVVCNLFFLSPHLSSPLLRRYFECPDNHGLLVAPTKCTKVKKKKKKKKPAAEDGEKAAKTSTAGAKAVVKPPVVAGSGDDLICPMVVAAAEAFQGWADKDASFEAVACTCATAVCAWCSCITPSCSMADHLSSVCRDVPRLCPLGCGCVYGPIQPRTTSQPRVCIAVECTSLVWPNTDNATR